MRTSVNDILPAKVRRSLTQLGENIAVARRRRRLTTAMMAERMGVARSTYGRIEQGDPTVALAAWAMALFVLGLDAPWGALADPASDEAGTVLENARLPQRVRARRPRAPVKKLPETAPVSP